MLTNSNVPGSPLDQQARSPSPSEKVISELFSVNRIPHFLGGQGESNPVFDSILQKNDQNQFSFITPRHINSFFKSLASFYQNNDLCDVKIRVGKKTFSAHRVILSAESPYFRAMFLSNCRESLEDEIVLKDVNETSFDHVLNYIYNGIITITRENVQSLLTTSCMLQIDDLKELCCCFLGTHLDVNNCLGIISFLDTLGGCKNLYALAKAFLLSNFKSITESEDFLHLTSRQLGEIICSDDLQVTNEEVVYRALMRWVYFDVNNRCQSLPQLLNHVRLPLMSPKFLISTVSGNDLIRSNETCRDLLDEAKNYHLLPLERETMAGPRTKPRKMNVSHETLIVIGGWSNGTALSSAERLVLTPPSLHAQHKTMSLKSFSQYCEENCHSLLRSVSLCPDDVDLSGPQQQQQHWEMMASMNSSRCGVGAVFLKDQLFVIGGHNGKSYLDTVERYDIVNNIWHTMTSRMTTKRASGGAVVLNNSIYAIGGQYSQDSLTVFEQYDPSKDVWMRMKNLLSPRLGLGATVLDDGRIFAIGGSDGNVPLMTAEFYDPREGRWQYARPMFENRKHLAVTTYRGLIYAVGGRSYSSEQDTVEAYDPIANNWTRLKSMATQRSGLTLSVYGDSILAIGGYDGKTYLKSCEQYDPETDTWTARGFMNYRRLGCGSVSVKLSDSHMELMAQNYPSVIVQD